MGPDLSSRSIELIPLPFSWGTFFCSTRAASILPSRPLISLAVAPMDPSTCGKRTASSKDCLLAIRATAASLDCLSIRRTKAAASAKPFCGCLPVGCCRGSQRRKAEHGRWNASGAFLSAQWLARPGVYGARRAHLYEETLRRWTGLGSRPARMSTGEPGPSRDWVKIETAT